MLFRSNVRVVLASGNAGKLRELAALLGPLGFDMISQSALGIETPPETGSTYLDNALLKARHAARLSNLPALADDSGLEVDALAGGPGLYSARYAHERASDAENNAKLLEQATSIIREYYWIETKRAGQACDERAGRFLKGLGKL